MPALTISRRKLLNSALAVSALAAMIRPARASVRFDMGLQMYTVRDPMAKAPLPTLKQIAALGYRNLETFGFDATTVGYYGMGAREFKRTLDDLNLRTTSGHYDLSRHLETPVPELRDYVSRCIEGAVALMRELEKTTELRVDTTENLANLNSANLAKYDLLFFANSTLRINPKDTTQAALRAVRLRAPIANAVTPEQQRAVIDFVRGGKGVVLAHAALDANYGWDEYRDMAGGGLFEAHPWTAHLRVINEAKTNPATRHMDDRFWIREEFYILDKSPRATSRVLLSLDNTSFGSPNMGRLPAPENSDHPVSWTRTYGQGRVFATILGHFRDTWQRPEFVQHLLTGIRMAAGRQPTESAARR